MNCSFYYKEVLVKRFFSPSCTKINFSHSLGVEEIVYKNYYKLRTKYLEENNVQSPIKRRSCGEMYDDKLLLNYRKNTAAVDV